MQERVGEFLTSRRSRHVQMFTSIRVTQAQRRSLVRTMPAAAPLTPFLFLVGLSEAICTAAILGASLKRPLLGWLLHFSRLFMLCLLS